MNELANQNFFAISRLESARKLTPSEMAKQYVETKTKSIQASYWTFNDDETQTEFTRNPNIVNELQEKLANEKNDKEIVKIVLELRKWKRFLKFVAIDTGTFLDEKTGELKEGAIIKFEDEYDGSIIEMGQAKLSAKFMEIEKSVRIKGATIEGFVFIVEYKGRTRNKKNDKRSDNFDISIKV